MTSEDYSFLEIAISCFLLCKDCIFYEAGICTKLKNINAGMLMCNEADGCTFGIIRKDK